MAVRIDVQADAQHVLTAFEQIRATIRATGQEGTAFKDLDFSHPELRELEADVKRVTEQFDNLSKIGRGQTATDLRSIRKRAGDDPFAWLEETIRTFPGEGERQGHVGRVGRQAFEGTRWQTPEHKPPAPPDPPAPADDDGDGDDEPERPDKPRKPDKPPKRRPMPFEQHIKGAAEFVVGATIGEGILRGIYGSYEGAKREDLGNDQLFRRLNDTSVSFDQLREKVRGLADTLSITDNEAQGLAQTWSRLTNTTSSDDAVRNVAYAGRFARGFGADPGSMVETFGRASYLGEDPRRFAVLLADAVHEGNRDGSIEETSRALLRWTETASRDLVTHDNLPQFSEMYAALNATGKPGLMGQNAEAILGQINGAIANGGGAGLPGQALMMRALMPFGIRNPYDASYQLSGGAFEVIPGTADREGRGGTTNLEAVMAQIQRSFPHASRHEMDSILSSIFGISQRQADAFTHVGSPADFGALDRRARAAGIDLSKIDDGGVLREMENVAAPNADLHSIERQMRARKDLDPTDTARLDAADKAGTPDALRTALFGVLGNRGHTQTPADIVRKGDADLSNQLERTASALVPPLSGVRDNLAKLLDPVNKIANVLSRTFEATTNAADTKDASAFATGIEDLPGYLQDSIEASRGNQAAAEDMESYQRHALEHGYRFFHPSGTPAGKGTAELAPDIANQAVKDAQRVGVDPADFLAVLRNEQGGYDGPSPAGAWGPAQLMPGTAADMGVTDIHDWKQNLAGGARYFRHLVNLFHGNVLAAVAGYNAGPAGHGVEHFAETGDESGLPFETRRYLSLFERYTAEYDRRRAEHGGDPNPDLTTARGHAPIWPKAPAPSAPAATGAPATPGSHAPGGPTQHDVHVHPLEVTVKQPDGSLQRKLLPVTYVPAPVAAGTHPPPPPLRSLGTQGY